MASPTGSWVEYDDGFDPRTEKQSDPTLIRVFSSEVAALRSAVAVGNLVTNLPFGKTIAEHLAESAPRIQESHAYGRDVVATVTTDRPAPHEK